MTEPAGAVLSRSRAVRVLLKLKRRRSSGSFFIFIERRLAGPGDLVREVLVEGLVGTAPWMTEPSVSEEAGFDPKGSDAGGLGSSSGMGLYQISPAGSPLLGVPGPKDISSGGLAPLSTHRRLLGSRLCR